MNYVGSDKVLDDEFERFTQLSSALDAKYSLLCQPFDNAEDFYSLEPSYAVTREVAINDMEELFEWSKLIRLLCDNNSIDTINKRIVISIPGRFFLLFYGSDFLSDECMHRILRESLANTLYALFSFDWLFDETPFLRITILNSLLLLNIQSSRQLHELITDELTKKADQIEHVGIVVKDSILWYINFIKKTRVGENIDPTWYYAYIFKKRFGVVYCKRIKRIFNNKYTYQLTAISPCFKGLKEKVVGHSAKGIIVVKGEQRRNSEYQPAERSWCYNWSTMQFE